MKYKILPQQDLKYLDEEFKHFLITNGISNEDWLEINKNNQDKAIDLVEVFSDIVYQKVFEKINFLEHQSKKSLLVFKLKKHTIELIGLQLKNNEGDFSSSEKIQHTLTNNKASIEIYRNNKKYFKEREVEIFEMIEKGCINSHESFWEKLNNLFS